MSIPLHNRIARLKAKKAALAARLNSLEAKAKRQDRRRDTRRKIVVGAAVLTYIERDEGFRLLLRAALRANVLRDADRDIIADLLG